MTFLIGSLVIIILIALLWLVVLWRYNQTRNLFQGVLLLLKFGGRCLLASFIIFMGVGLVAYYLQESTTEGVNGQLVFRGMGMIMVIVNALILLWGGMKGYKKSGELLADPIYAPKRFDILDD